MSDERKVDPWSKLNETQLAERRRLIHAANQKAEAQRGRAGGGKTAKGDVPFWATEVWLNKGTLLLRFVPGRYLVPRHVAEAYPHYQESTPEAHFVWMEHRFSALGKYGVEVFDATDLEEGKCLGRFFSEGRRDYTYRMMSLYNVVDRRYWHKVSFDSERRGADGKTRTFEDVRWELCGEKQCKLCVADNTRYAGRPGFLKLSPAYEASLGRIEETIGRFCRCGCTDPLSVLSINCDGCDHAFVEADFDETGEVLTPITAAMMLDVYETHAHCPYCDLPLSAVPLDGPRTRLVEEMTCRGCARPERASIYDADVALRKQGTAPAVYLELDTSRYNGRGFRIAPPQERTQELATVYDFARELGIGLRLQAVRLGISPQDNPYIEKGSGYNRRD